MAETKALTNAPITEALIDFKVNVPTSLDVRTALETIGERLKGQYPQVQTQIQFKGEIKFTPESVDVIEGESGRQIIGRLYRSEDELQVVQTRLNGFTFHRLEPYTTWEELLPEALRLWATYCEIFTPTEVSQLSVRFINHLSLPSSIEGLGEFLTTLPRIPEPASHRLTNFLTRFTIAESDSDIETDITQGLAENSDDDSEGKTVVILDINAYQAFESGLNPDNTENITDTLNQLRHIKNKTFFGSITERTVALFS